MRDAPDGAEGLWAAVAGLPRPERARIVNVDTGAEVVVALFAARRGSGAEIRLSNQAADALGIGDRPTPVHITALRRQAADRLQPLVDFDRRAALLYPMR